MVYPWFPNIAILGYPPWDEPIWLCVQTCVCPTSGFLSIWIHIHLPDTGLKTCYDYFHHDFHQIQPVWTFFWAGLMFKIPGFWTWLTWSTWTIWHCSYIMTETPGALSFSGVPESPWLVDDKHTYNYIIYIYIYVYIYIYILFLYKHIVFCSLSCLPKPMEMKPSKGGFTAWIQAIIASHGSMAGQVVPP